MSQLIVVTVGSALSAIGALMVWALTRLITTLSRLSSTLLQMEGRLDSHERRLEHAERVLGLGAWAPVLHRGEGT